MICLLGENCLFIFKRRIVDTSIISYRRLGLLGTEGDVGEADPGGEEGLHDVLEKVSDGLHRVVGGEAGQHAGPCTTKVMILFWILSSNSPERNT